MGLCRTTDCGRFSFPGCIVVMAVAVKVPSSYPGYTSRRVSKDTSISSFRASSVNDGAWVWFWLSPFPSLLSV
jgi:hypothetical protein